MSITKIKTKTAVSIFVLMAVFSTRKAFAACPVCTLAVGGALVLLERFGVDNTISGLWIGGFLLSSSLWAINWIRKKKYEFKGFVPLVLIFFYGSLILPLYAKNIIGASDRLFWGVDKTLVGIGLGSIFFYFGHIGYLEIKKRNGGKPWFPFQKVLMPIAPLVVLSAIFYFITEIVK